LPSQPRPWVIISIVIIALVGGWLGFMCTQVWPEFLAPEVCIVLLGLHFGWHLRLLHVALERRLEIESLRAELSRCNRERQAYVDETCRLIGLLADVRKSMSHSTNTSLYTALNNTDWKN